MIIKPHRIRNMRYRMVRRDRPKHRRSILDLIVMPPLLIMEELMKRLRNWLNQKWRQR